MHAVFSPVLFFIIWKIKLIVSVASSFWARVFSSTLYPQHLPFNLRITWRFFKWKLLGNYVRWKSSKRKKVKFTLVQALRLCTGRTAHRGSRGIALLFHDHGTIRGWGVSVTPRLLFTPGKDSVPIVQEAGWAPGPVWTGVENLAPTGIRSPDRQARSQSLYWLSYPAHTCLYSFILKIYS